MMEVQSPFVRRLLALGILFVVVVSFINLGLLPLADGLRNSLGRLEDTRFARAQAEAIAGRPVDAGTPVPPMLFIQAGAPTVASAKLADLARSNAAERSLVVTGLSVLPSASGRPGLIAVSLSLEGKELDVARFLQALEAGRPVVRFGSWRIVRANGPSGGVHFDGQLEAAWGKAP